MSKKVYEGQLDFLGLLNEYTDSQGATVRVREPGNSRLKPVEKGGSKFKVSEAVPEQLKLDFDSVQKPEVSVETVKTEPVKETVKPEPAKEPAKASEPVKAEPVKAELIKEEPTGKEPAKEAPKPKASKKETEKPEAVKTEPVEPAATEPKPAKPEVAKPEPTEPAPVSGNGEAKEILFKQCKKCWCFDCKHNSRNEGVVRDLCGTMMPCPACESCISEEQATVCEIGNAKEGCKLRAKEEGILTEEEPE